MMTGKRYFNNDVFYAVFKKHYCPQCGTKLGRIRTSKIVNSKSPEAKNYDFSLGDSFMVGDVEFIWKEFYCPKCERRISIEKMRRIEKAKNGRLQTGLGKPGVSEQNYYDRFVELSLQQCLVGDYGDKKRVKVHNRAVKELEQLKQEIANEGEEGLLTNLLSHEDGRVKCNAAVLCLQLQKCQEAAITELNTIAQSHPDGSLRFSAKRILQE